MRTFDLAPLYRSTVGFDRLFSLINQIENGEAGNASYPPYNIEKVSEDGYRISLAVAGILVMNVMLVSVTQRTAEVGLLKALGATARTIRHAFLAEAAMLSLIGAVLGILLGEGSAAILRHLYPSFPAYPPDWAIIAGFTTAIGTGLLFGVMPARRAADLDAVVALARH